MIHKVFWDKNNPNHIIEDVSGKTSMPPNFDMIEYDTTTEYYTIENNKLIVKKITVIDDTAIRIKLKTKFKSLGLDDDGIKLLIGV